MNEPPATPSRPSTSTTARPRREAFTRSVGNGSVRETIESIVIAFIFAFLFRAFVVEAFVIPTGSMAPTLLGEHVRVRCSMCGYRFPVGPGGRYGGEADIPCPMCLNPIDLPAGGLVSGDRILVLKYLYAFAEPERWDVVVFKNPTDPDENYIKRLVGLPGEQLRIMDGNIYTRPLGPDGQPPPPDAPWIIQRKPPDAQRAVWQPVYHSDYLPLDGGEAESPLSDRRNDWRVPWRPAGPTAAWAFDPHGPRWRYRPREQRPGVLRFDFTRHTIRNFYSYNALLRGGGGGQGVLDEMRIAATVVPEREGARLTMTCGGGKLLRAIIEPDGRVILQSAPRPNDLDAPAPPQWIERARGRVAPLTIGRATRVELWYADQAMSLWIDGRRVADWSYQVDVDRLRGDRRPDPPLAQIMVEGAPVRLRSVNLDRDLYYTQTDKPDALATHDEPAIIPEDRFLCLGDNSPQSKDSRLWERVNPRVKELTGVQVGLVPRDLMIGRAFFVYWPAMWNLRPGGVLAVPNFADMRFIK